MLYRDPNCLDCSPDADTVIDSHGYYIFLSLEPGVYFVSTLTKGYEDNCGWYVAISADSQTQYNTYLKMLPPELPGATLYTLVECARRPPPTGPLSTMSMFSIDASGVLRF
jgi:hypothetical protein